MNDFPRNENGGRPGPGSEDEQLRRLFNDAVSDVDPPEALDSIRGRTAVTPLHPKRPWILGAGAAVVATAATVTAVAVMGGNPGTTTADDPGFAGSGAPTSGATEVQSAEPSPTITEDTAGPSPSAPATEEAPATGEPTTIPVYYVGDTFQGPRLYREFHRATTSDPVTAAVAEAVAGRPADPDYRQDWPEGTTVASVASSSDLVEIDLAEGDTPLRERPAGMSEAEAQIAVEQVIHTAQAATQTRAPVQLLVDGERTDMVLGVPTAEPLAEGDPSQVLSLVWIINLSEGDEVTSPFEVSGTANAFEANVQWELMQGETVVAEDFTTAEECCRMAPYSFTVDAPPGEYTLVVHDSDASGQGNVFSDTKRITVVP